MAAPAEHDEVKMGGGLGHVLTLAGWEPERAGAFSMLCETVRCVDATPPGCEGSVDGMGGSER